MNMQKILLFLMVCTSLVYCIPQSTAPSSEEKQSFDDLINQISAEERNQTVSTKPPTLQNPCPAGAQCLPYYQCVNESIITNSESILNIRGEDDEQPSCESILEVCCFEKRIDPPTTPMPVVDVGCGIRNVNGVGFRIIGNEVNEAQFGEFPWTIDLLKEVSLDGQILEVHICGGSLIDADIVLTAAHCVDQKDPKILKIRAGEWDTLSKIELFPHQDRQVRDYVIHPEYYRNGLYNDVALLFLAEPVEITENVNVICLPSKDDVFDNARCFASGWGEDLVGKGRKYQGILRRIELPIVPRDPCVQKFRNTRLGKHFRLHPSFICAGGEGHRGLCKGGGGSPLVCPISNSTGRYVQAGVVSWGLQCGTMLPGVYVNMPHIRDWIDETKANHLYIRWY